MIGGAPATGGGVHGGVAAVLLVAELKETGWKSSALFINQF